MIERDFARIFKSGDEALKHHEIQRVQGVLASESEAVTDEGDRIKKAYEEGVAVGERLGREAAGALIEQQNRLLADLVQEVRRLRDSLLKDAEQMIAGLSLEIAKKVIREQLEVHPELVLGQVREAIARLKEVGTVRVLVNPDDVPLLQAVRETLEKGFDGTVSLQVEGDATISRGGCLVETPAHLVDARLEAQLVRIGEALREKKGAAG